MKTTVIHHSADYDGIFCREIAKKFLPDATLIGWDFTDSPLQVPEGKIYVMDLPVDRVFGFDYTKHETILDDNIDYSNLVWIDHHKSSIETHPKDIPGYRIDGVAACRLAWFYFTALERYKSQTTTADFTWFQGHYPWASKQDFIDRKVSEPLSVRLAGEYDVWEHKLSDGDDIVFQFGLDSLDLNGRWNELLSLSSRPSIEEVERLISVGHAQNLIEPDGTTRPAIIWAALESGRAAMRCYAKRDADVMREQSFIVDWEGLKFLALNTPRCNSNTFNAKDLPETGHDALMAFYWNGKEWNFSLYHANHRKEMDLSLIAVKHGGGGHRGACGFRLKELPFK